MFLNIELKDKNILNKWQQAIPTSNLLLLYFSIDNARVIYTKKV